MAFTGTPAAEQCERAVLKRFASLILSVGQYNRRRIANSTAWSQHSWGNGLDFMVGLGNYAAGDVIYAWLLLHREELGIRSILWRVRDHHDHIHVEFFPYGRYTPPLTSTGIGTFRYSDGRQVSTRIQIVPAETVWTEEDEEEVVTRKTQADNGNEALAVYVDQLVAEGVFTSNTQPGGVTFNDELAKFLVTSFENFEAKLIEKYGLGSLPPNTEFTAKVV